jgi:hypothetical protein
MRVGIALTPYLYLNHTLEDILGRFERLKDEVSFGTIELQFQRTIRLAEGTYSVNSLKLKELLPPILKSYSFDWTFHDDYRLGYSPIEHLVRRYRLYRAVTDRPTISLHLPNRGKERKLLPKVLADGEKIRQRMGMATLYVENNSRSPHNQPFYDPNDIAKLVDKLKFSGLHLDIAHYLDSKAETPIELNPPTLRRVRYAHVSGCAADVRAVYPERWGEVLRALRQRGKTPRHLPLVKSSPALKLLAQTAPRYVILEIDPERLAVIGDDVWKWYPTSLRCLHNHLERQSL